eukprot:402672_1
MFTMSESFHSDKKIAKIVYGYVRRIQKSLLKKRQWNVSKIIPNELVYICLSYYHVKEHFVAVGAGVIIEENDCGATIVKGSHSRDWRNSSFGNIAIDVDSNYVCKWTLKFNCLSAAEFVAVGLTSNSVKSSSTVKAFNMEQWTANYSYCGSGMKCSRGNRRSYGDGFTSGDTVSIELNCKQKSVSFYKNKVNQGVAFNKIPNGSVLKLAVTLFNVRDSVTIDEYIKYTL